MGFEFRIKDREEKQSLLGPAQETLINSAVKRGFSRDGTDLGELVDVIVDKNLEPTHQVFQKEGKRSYIRSLDKVEPVNRLGNKLKHTARCRLKQLVPSGNLWGTEMRLQFADMASYGETVQIDEEELEKEGLVTLAGTYQVQGKDYELVKVCCGKKGISEMVFVPLDTADLYLNRVKVKGQEACRKTLAQKK